MQKLLEIFWFFQKIVYSSLKSIYSLKMFWKRSREHTKHFLFQHESGMSPAGPNFRIAEKKKEKTKAERDTEQNFAHF